MTGAHCRQCQQCSPGSARRRRDRWRGFEREPCAGKELDQLKRAVRINGTACRQEMLDVLDRLEEGLIILGDPRAIDGEAIDDVIMQRFCSPFSELNSPCGIGPISNGKYYVQVIELDLIRF